MTAIFFFSIFLMAISFRLAPPFAAMILIQATIFPYFGDGPLWHTFSDDAAKICQENWWQGLLYVSNFLNPNTTVVLFFFFNF